MARLPTPGGDNGNWGDILNDFLSQTLKQDGSLRSNTVGSAQMQPNAINSAALAPNSVTNDALASNTVDATIIQDGSITEGLLDSALQAKVNTLAPVTSVASRTGSITLNKADVGLSNVDNTTDLDKPVSNATQTALDTKITKSNSASRIYGTNHLGDQALWALTNQLAPWTILLRDENNRSRIADGLEPDDIVNKRQLDSKVEQTSTGSRIYGTNGVGSQVTYTLSIAANADTIPARGSSATLKVGTPSGGDDATTKLYVDTALSAKADVTTTGAKVLRSAVFNLNPEGLDVNILPGLQNDLMYNTLRGGTISVTKNGSPYTFLYTENLFTPDPAFVQDSPTVNSDVFIITVGIADPLTWNGRYGIVFAHGWHAANVKIEVYYSGAWTTVYDISDTPEQYFHASGRVSSNTSNPVTQIRYTLTNLNSNILRISSLFAFDFNSIGIAEGFLPRVGGQLYGPIRHRDYTTAGRPFASTVGKGTQIFDGTLNKPLWSDGTNWVDANGNTV